MYTTMSSLLSRGGAAAAALLALLGCSSGRHDMTGPIVGVPVGMPDHFLVARTGLGQAEDPKPGEPCRNPLIDPRGKTILTLRRSADGKGDYWVGTLGDESQGVGGREYGITSRQLLRVDCATGKPLGIVDE